MVDPMFLLVDGEFKKLEQKPYGFMARVRTT